MNGQPCALVVEDEAALADELCDLLHVLWPELRVTRAADGAGALRAVLQERPDIVFLDIQIPDPNGLEVARIIRDTCHIVFVTAYDAHAIEAFERGAVDYLLKPVVAARLEQTVLRLKQRIGMPPPDLSALAGQLQGGAAPSSYLRWLTATVGQSLRLIMVDEVVFFQADQKFTRVVLPNAEFLVRRSLKELLAELDPGQFWQTYRNTVVNALEIASIEPNLAGQLAIRLKSRREQLPVSETFLRKFRQL
jgi:DNA-binding LytR/AlgR family response regulator